MRIELLEKYGYSYLEYDRAVIEHPDDAELVRAVCQEYPYCIKYANESFRNNKNFIMSILRKGKAASILEHLPKNLRDDREIVRLCVSLDGRQLEYVSDKYKYDKEIALTACKSDGEAIYYVNPIFRADKKFLITVCEIARKNRGKGFNRITDELKKDEEIVRAFCCDGDNFSFFDENFRDNKELAMLACSNKVYAYEYASDRLRDDEELTEYAVLKSSCGWLFKYASDRLKNDADFVKRVCSKSATAIEYASDKVKKDRKLILSICQENADVFSFVHEIYADDEEIAELVLKDTNGYNLDELKFFSERLRDNKKFVMGWCKKNGSNLEYASERLKNDLQVCQIAALHGASFSSMGKKVRDNKEFAYMMLTKSWHYSIPAKYKNDPEFVFAALNRHFPSIYHWRIDDHFFDNEVNFFDELGDEIKKDEGFAKLVIDAFFKTSYSEKYSKSKINDNVFCIYDVLKQEMITVDSDDSIGVKEGLDFSNSYAKYAKQKIL